MKLRDLSLKDLRERVIEIDEWIDVQVGSGELDYHDDEVQGARADQLRALEEIRRRRKTAKRA